MIRHDDNLKIQSPFLCRRRANRIVIY